jgi:hypothetical protein
LVEVDVPKDQTSGATAAAAEYFDTLLGVFEKAASGRLLERDLQLGDLRVRLRFAGDAVTQTLCPPLEHLAVPRGGLPHSQILIWDDHSTGTRLPEFPWHPRDVGPHGLITSFESDQLRIAYHGNVAEPPHFGFNALSMYAPRSRTGLFWVSSPARLPWHESVEPLRTCLHWVLAGSGWLLVHAGAVASDDGCVLLAGEGFAGKTTTAVACAETGLRFMGDNYIAIAPALAQPRAHSIFGNAKLRAGSIELLPGLRSRQGEYRRTGDRLVVDFHTRHPERLANTAPIRAVLIVRHGKGHGCRLQPATPAHALRVLAPSSIYQLPNNRGTGLAPMAELVRRVPSYRIEVGPDPLQAGPVIAELIRSLAHR